MDNRRPKSNWAEKTASLQDLQTTLDSLQQQQEELDKQLQTANETVAAAIQKQEAALPHLEEARALDVQIKEKAEQVNQAATEVKDREVNHEQLQQQLQAQQQQSEELLAYISQLQQWKQDNSARQPIAENHNLISAKLGDAGTLRDAAQVLLPHLEHTQTSIAEAKQVKTGLKTISAAIVQQLQVEKKKHIEASEALVAIPIASLEKEKVSTDSRIEDMIAAEAHWKILSHGEADLDTLKQKLTDNKSELNDKSQALAWAAAQLVIATAERDASLRMLDKARLAAAENVESLRLQLVPEEPCPVCGSLEHPTLQNSPN